MVYLATACAADEINPIYFQTSFAALFIASALSLLALAMGIFSSRNLRMALRLAITGGMFSFFPALFSYHLYRIDFVAVERDGTPASPPLYKSMTVPALPLLSCLGAGVIAWARLKKETRRVALTRID